MSFLEIILVTFYSALFSFIILRLKFFQRFHLSGKVIVALFIFKVIAGIFYGYIHLKFYGGGDTYAYFDDSLYVFSTLKTNPWLYVRLVFGLSNAHPAPDIVPYKDAMMYYTNPDAYLLVRFHSLLRIISFGFYNVHVVFYNFITLVGCLYLFRFLSEILPAKKELLLGAVFLFPSIAFWSSGIHKDGISMADLGLILFFSNKIFITPGKKSFRRFSIYVVCWIAGLILLLFIRTFLFLLLIPVLTAWLITMKYPAHKLMKCIIVLCIYFGLASNLNVVWPDWDFLNRIVFMQNEFKIVADESFQVPIPSIIPTIGSVLSGVPMALENCLIRPWIGETENVLQVISSIENIMILLLLLAAIIFRKKKLSDAEQSLLLFSLFFAFSIFIVVGITVPILGALVRYKIAGILFLLISAVVLTRPFSFRKSVPESL